MRLAARRQAGTGRAPRGAVRPVVLGAALLAALTVTAAQAQEGEQRQLGFPSGFPVGQPTGDSFGAPLGTPASPPPAAGPAGNPGTGGAPILTLNEEQMFTDSLWGKRAQAEFDKAAAALTRENRRIEAELATEEKTLTDRRRTMAAADFRAAADAFDVKVTGIRNAQDVKARALTQQREAERRAFFNAALPVLSQLLQDYGAVAILDGRAILLAQNDIDVTSPAIALIDARLGPGTAPGDTGGAALGGKILPEGLQSPIHGAPASPTEAPADPLSQALTEPMPAQAAGQGFQAPIELPATPEAPATGANDATSPAPTATEEAAPGVAPATTTPSGP